VESRSRGQVWSGLLAGIGAILGAFVCLYVLVGVAKKASVIVSVVTVAILGSGSLTRGALVCLA